jgi:uncharacterized membrane protein
VEFSQLFADHGAFITRWLHVFFGIIWIGLLYYFNFVQMPFFAETEAPVRSGAIQKLVPRALKWFAMGSGLTWVTGIYLLYRNAAGNMSTYWTSPQGVIISIGSVLGTIMMLNVMMIILPKQKIVIASTKAVAAGGQPDPRQPASANQAAVASRTNALFSIPLLFTMSATGHMPTLPDTEGGTAGFYIFMFALILILEANVLFTKKLLAPLKSPMSVIISGFVFTGVFVGALLTCF